VSQKASETWLNWKYSRSAIDLGCSGQYARFRARGRVGGVETHTQRLGNIVLRVFTPVLAKHTKSFNLIDTLSVGVDRFSGTSNRCNAQG
jgi:hypothetical protein